jgi:hypothetical protein
MPCAAPVTMIALSAKRLGKIMPATSLAANFS